MQDIYTKILKSKKFQKFGIPSILFILVTSTFFIWTSQDKEVEAGWWNESWNYRKTITINHNYVAGNLENFPVLVSLTDTDFIGKAQDDADDFVFTNYSGSEILKHEIESYASSTGEIVAWVKLPSISSTTDTLIQMYYGNASVNSQQSPSDVWDDDYIFVHHMGDMATSTRNDSTKNNRNFVTYGFDSDVATSSGKIGRADHFDDTNDYMSIPLDASDYDEITMSVWYKADVQDTQGEIFVWGDTIASGNNFASIYQNNIDSGVFRYYSDNTTRFQLSSDNTNWHYGVITLSSSNLWTFYHDATSTTYQDGITHTHQDDAKNIFIGNDWYGYFDGIIDEIRLSKIARSEEWIDTEYNNQNDPSTFLSASAEEVGQGPVGHWSFDDPSSGSGDAGGVHDNSSGGYDGTNYNAVQVDESMCVSGKCLYFDGENLTRVEANTQNNMEKFTACTWFKANSYSNTDNDGDIVLLSKGWFLEIQNSENIRFMVPASSSYPAVTSSFLPSLNNWHHICAVFYGIGTNPKMYINGIEDSFDNNSGSGTLNENNTHELSIGSARNEYSGNFHGYIDEVKIYPYARSSDQIKQDYNAGLAGVSSPKGISASFGGKSDSWMSDGLVGYWKFDETATTSGAIDASGNGNDGIYYSTASTTGGKFGNSAIFDGVDSTSDDYVGMGDKFDFERTDPFSIFLWVKSSYTSGAHSIVGKMDNGEGFKGYEIWDDGATWRVNIRNDYYSSNQIVVSSLSDLSDQEWHFVGFTYDGSSRASGIKMYLDGNLDNGSVDSDSLTDTILNDHTFAVGARNGVVFNYGGQIDDLRIYNRTLSPDEVKKLYQWAPGPVLHLKMDEKQGTTAYDSSGYGNDGTLINSPAWSRGKYGGALNFNGNDSYLSTSDIDQNASGGITISSWIKADSCSGDNSTCYIVSKEQEGFMPPYSLSLFYGAVRFQMGGGGISHTFDAFDSNWHHITAVSDGVNKYLYVDGVLENTSIVGALYFNDELTVVGGDDNSPSYRPFNGLIDDVKIYNYARTQKQILEDMSGGQAAQKSPVAYYKFDEGYGGTAHDSSGNGYHGTLIPGTSGVNTTASQMWSLDGKINKAMEFDGYNDRITVPGLDIHDYNDFTISAWYKSPDASVSYDEYIYYHLETGYSINLSITDDSSYVNSIRFSLNDGGGLERYYSNFKLDDTDWHHILVARDNGYIKMYIDGELDKEEADGTSGTISIDADDDRAFIGISNVGTNDLEGLLDEMKLWDYALSEEEIKKEYNQGFSAVFGSAGTDSSGASTNSHDSRYCVPGSADFCAPPVGEWSFDEKTGTTAYDTSGNGNDGVISGATWARGESGSALNYTNTSNEKVLINNDDSINNLDSLTFSTWIFHKGGDVYYDRIISKEGTGFLTYYHEGYLYFEALRWDVDEGGRWRYSYSDMVNNWNHLAISYDYSSTSNNPIFYINGESQQVTEILSPSGNLKNDLADLCIGNNCAETRPFNGLIDEVKIYNYARTPAQIAWDYNQGKPVAEWRFNECEGATAHDDSGNGHHATINIGASGLQSTLGNCATTTTSSAWYNGRNGKVNSSLSFDGTDDYVSVGNLGTSINSISFWSKQDYLSNYFLDLDGGTSTISLSNSQVTTTGITSPKIYINGIEKTNIPDNSWQHITIVTNTSINVSNMNIGRIGTDYYAGLFDEIKLFNYPLTNEQVKTNYSGGAVNFGGLAKETGSALVPSWSCGDPVYNDNDSITYPTVLADDGNCWLASNLGTANIATARNDSSAYGAYYQWGRLADGHQISTSGTTATLSTTDVPGHGNFITSGSSPYDWRNPQNDNLWQDVDGINNPCPTGWRLPTQPEWSAVVSAENINNYTEAASSNLKLPAAGYRDRPNGSMDLLGSYGFYWSASPNGSDAYYLFFSSSGVNPAGYNYRAFGFSVRCLKD